MRLDAARARKVIEERCEDFFARVESHRAVVALGSAYEQAVQPLLVSPRKQARELACDILAEIGTAKSIAPITQAVGRITDRREREAFQRKADATIARIRQRQGGQTP
jgi:hypothetical protein